MEVLGRVTLVTGKEEFLGERTVAAVREAVRRADPEAEFSETQGSGLTLATLGELAAPVAVQLGPLRRRPAGSRTCPRSRSTGCSTTPARRPRTSRWCWCTPAAPRAAAC